MLNAASAFKADYNSLTEARIAFSYGLTYPENLIKKQDKQKRVATGGWFWPSSWSLYVAFKGTFNNGAKDSVTSSLTEVSGMIQNAIDFVFPLATLPLLVPSSPSNCFFLKPKPQPGLMQLSLSTRSLLRRECHRALHGNGS